MRLLTMAKLNELIAEATYGSSVPKRIFVCPAQLEALKRVLSCDTAIINPVQSIDSLGSGTFTVYADDNLDWDEVDFGYRGNAPVLRLSLSGGEPVIFEEFVGQEYHESDIRRVYRARQE